MDIQYRKEPIKMKSKMKEIMTNYFLEAFDAKNRGKKVAWITSGGPVEPLIAMDVIPIYPENHGAMIGASKMGDKLVSSAESLGYSCDLCSYATADIACSRGEKGPIGHLPQPDMLICCNNICSTVVKWYEIQARYFDVPLFILDTPMCHKDFTEEIKEYVQKQFDELFLFLENVCGKKMDFDTLEKVGRLSIEAQRLWQKILDTTVHSPAPMSAFDAFFHLALIVTLRGTDVCVNYYRELLDEMEDRVKNGICAVPGEKYRILWDNLPIWYKTKWLSEKFAERDVCLVADTYTSAWCSSLKYIDEDDFLGSIATAYIRIYLNQGIDIMAEEVIKMIDKYRVHGLVMHSNRSCKPYSFGQYDIQRIVREKTGLPILIIEADMLDQRSFSDAQIESRIDAFCEILGS
ncbi:2-hydroxyacyl-CoA dehydratase subunit D [Desulfothermus okinawensis JCM 13304]